VHSDVSAALLRSMMPLLLLWLLLGPALVLVLLWMLRS